MDPKNQPQFNPKIPISEVLKQEQAGYTPSTPPPTPTPKLNDVVDALQNGYTSDVRAVSPASAIVPEGPIVKNEVQKSIPQDQGNPVRIIKTYRSDAAEAVKTQRVSVAKMTIAEDTRRRSRGEEIGGTKPKKKVGLLITIVIFISFGAAAIPAVNYILNLKKQAVSISLDKTIIPFDHQDNLVLNNATRNEFVTAVNGLSTQIPVPSTIEYIKVLEKIKDVEGNTITRQIAPNIFAGLIGPNMPSALARSFDSAYMYGIENSVSPKPFILLKTSSYDQAFANMLNWETKMIGDLTPILHLDASLNGQSFIDRVLVNKDIRAITAPDGTLIFLYGFLDNQTLVITTNAQTFQDINGRYIATRFVQ
jgi:hypothetical protein